ncbi:DUF3667 domain-containing protein [Flavobacterium enshiense]|uniref:DUF3667 domain-containing protein n=1 Tax=Flavobacterium enshiense TaxID=1341165 RepID=UPI00345D6CF4
MSKNTLREDKTCLNCGTTVEDRFCPQCGQENTETRKSFHYLFTHFVEDLIHYDSGFWKTMKYLLFYPAKLTREYLSGRRKAYVVPVKLYIFISFVTFFLAGFILNPDNIANNKNDSFIKISPTENKSNIKVWDTRDSIQNKEKKTSPEKYGWFPGFKTVQELDSVQNALPANKKMNKYNYWVLKKIIAVSEHNTPKQAAAKALVLFKQNLPKVLFLYMPLFAFWLWLIHGKKYWYYFDHGIFTLHYFSFLLLLTVLLIIAEWILSHSNHVVIIILKIIIRLTYFFWPIIYFYKSHKRLYAETKFVSFLKSSLLFLINFILISLIMGLCVAYSFISVK